MVKILVFLGYFFQIFAMEDEADVIPLPSPMRRCATHCFTHENNLKKWGLADRLVYMVNYTNIPEMAITEEQIVRLINASPARSNPYSDKQNAYLITLAAREGLFNVVKAIVECNQSSISCLSYGYTPLDESIEFKQKEVAKYLHSLKAPQVRTNADQLKMLLWPKKRKSG